MKKCNVCEEKLPLEEFARNGNAGRSICKKCCVKRVRENQRKFSEWVSSHKIPCVLCGYFKLDKAIEWHHLDESTKSFNISSFSSKNYPSAKNKALVEKEMAKCVCLCANCHREVHEGFAKIV